MNQSIKLENTLAFTLQLLHNNEYSRKLMELAIEDGMLPSFHEVIPYNLLFSTDTYIDELLNHFHEKDKQAGKITQILIKWFKEKTYLDIHNDFMNGNKELHQNYDPSCLYFFFILSGNYKAFIDMYQDGHAFMTVSSLEYGHLLEENKKNERNADYEKQYSIKERQLIAANEKLKNCEAQLETYRTLVDRYPKLKAKIHLIHKQVALFVGAVNSEKIENIREKYNLKELRIYSSLDTMPKLLPAFDYVIFSTQMAKHSTYYQVKSCVKGSILHTDKLNLELILEELEEYIQRKEGSNYDSV